MKKKLLLLTHALLLCFFNPFHSTGEELLNHKKVDMENEYIGFPGPFIPINDGFIGIEFNKNSPPLLQLKQINAQYVVTHFGNRGQGPGDFITVSNIQVINKDLVGVFDRGSSSYFEFPTSNVENMINNKKVKFERSYFRVIKTNDSQYIGLSTEDGLFHIMDSAGEKKEVFFEYPFKDKNEQSKNNSSRAMSYQGLLETNPQKTKFAYASQNGEILHFYQIDKNQITLINKIEKAYPVSETININNSPISRLDFKNTEKGYISLYASDKYLYALYCGKKIIELIEGMAVIDMGTQVRVFDWNGKLIRTLQLDVPCQQICVSPDEKRLWAFALIPEATPVFFELE